jgi:hypothetical protein
VIRKKRNNLTFKTRFPLGGSLDTPQPHSLGGEKKLMALKVPANSKKKTRNQRMEKYAKDAPKKTSTAVGGGQNAHYAT